jgi:hypothetical protein
MIIREDRYNKLRIHTRETGNFFPALLPQFFVAMKSPAGDAASRIFNNVRQRTDY